MNNKLSILLLLFFMLFNACKQDVPLVYTEENSYNVPIEVVLRDTADLKIIEPLTDPFEFSGSEKRSEKFKDWPRRRAEIAKEIQHYEIGQKPKRPDSISANYSGDSLTIIITRNGQTLKMVSHIVLPEGEGPFPAVIGIGRGSGSLPMELFTERNIAMVPFQFWDVMNWEQKRGQEHINKLYPELTYMGAYSAWSWGISRLIDGLELVAEELPLDLNYLAITGCSFAGKMALLGGAFDERIALTIAQESGGGGAASWRVSETLGNVESLRRTSHLWFIEDLFKFSKSVSKLPYDHHELMAMVAPRALLVLGNPDYEWLADESGYVSCRAAQKVWETFGISDRFGFSIVGGHPHCKLAEEQFPEVVAFIEKFLLGNNEVNTAVEIHPFPNVDYKKWFAWWGTGKPEFPVEVGENSSK